MNQVTRENMLQNLRRRSPEAIADLARRSLRVTVLKKVLPVAGALLLIALVLAPSWKSGPDANRVTYHVDPGAAGQPSSRLLGAKYHGTDQQGQPFTVTADSAVERGADDVVLSAPIGDITLKSGAWLMLKSATGLYHPHSDMLNLTGAVTLYRNDGTILTTPDVKVDLRAGSAVTSSPVQVQGPFGTLTAQNGFTLTNRGAAVTFNGPATLVLSQAQ